MEPARNVEERKGSPIRTFSGISFWPLDPRPEEVNIIDIAHSLSMQCRFNGHIRPAYSVAEHCVRVASECSAENALYGLMHDASEAYLCDLPAPIKAYMPTYKMQEKVVQAVICKKYGLPVEEPAEVKLYDNILRITEMRDLRIDGFISNGYEDLKPLEEKIVPWSQEKAKMLFLQSFKALTK